MRLDTCLAKVAAFTVLMFSVLPATAQILMADEKPIFGDLTGLSCKGAGDSAFPGFTVASFSFGDSLVSGASSGLAGGKPSFQDISVVKSLDDCTPLLFEAVAKGSHFATATITVVNRGSKTPLLVIQLTDVVVSSDKFTEGAAKELDEVLSLTYSKITITHVPSGNKVTIDVATGSVA